LTLSYARANKSVTLTLYRNQVQDFIYLDPQNNFVLTIRGAFPAYFYAQADAVLQGLDLSADWPLFAGLAVEARASVLRGYRVVVDSGETARCQDWLPLMPTDRFQYGLRYTFKAGENGHESYIRFGATTALLQTRIPDAGLLKAAPGAFTLLGLDAAHTVWLGKKPLELGISIQNLGNLRYREYLNFFRYYADEVGVQVGVRAKWIF
jgi:iron complex outermembrane receptor protein